jgi:lipid-A-disaccharide synthase
MKNPPTYMIVAGETSGDLLGSHVIEAIKAKQPNAIFFGMGGERMRQAGLECLVSAEDMAIVGITEVFKQLGKILQNLKKLKIALKERKPDSLILIDYPDFNMRLARFASRQTTKVIYYVSPQIWAWRSHRIHALKRDVDHMAVLFPFEQKLYQQANVPATVVGHPLTLDVPQNLSRTVARQRLGYQTGDLIIGLMPGSRHQEVKGLLSEFVKSAQKIQARHPRAKFILPLAPHIPQDLLNPTQDLDIQITKTKHFESIKACDLILCASGTATLEVALLGIPMIIAYRVTTLSYWIGKLLIKTPYIGLCNIVANQLICPELIQKDANAEQISQAALLLLENKSSYRKTCQQLQRTREHLGQQVNLDRLVKLCLTGHRT